MKKVIKMTLPILVIGVTCKVVCKTLKNEYFLLESASRLVSLANSLSKVNN